MANLKKYDAVLFDLDGTLVDNYTAIYNTSTVVFREFGVSPLPTREEVVKAVGGSILLTLKRLLSSRGRECDADKIGARYIEIFPNYVLDGLKVLDGADEIVSELSSRGFKLACFTNKQQSGAEALLQRTKFGKKLDAIVGTTLHSPRKPDIAFTKIALDALGTVPSKTISIGDSPYDYNAAQAASLDCALVSTGADSGEALRKTCPNALGVFKNLKELAKNIFGIAL